MEFAKPKLLLVDDRVANLMVLESVLAPLGLDLHRALSGDEALALTLEHDYALALIDVQMPAMDGFELANLLHNSKATAELPIIFVSAVYSGDVVRVRGVESGAVDFIEKPIEPKLLLGKVRLFVELYQLRRESILSVFKGLAWQLPEGLLLCDKSGDVVLANPAAIDLAGEDFDDLYGRLSASGEERCGASRVRLSGLDGEEHLVDLVLSEIDWYGVTLCVASLHDVTEREEYLSALEKLNNELTLRNEELDSFAYTVSHDLKAPLVTISGFAGLLRQELRGQLSDETRGWFEEIDAAAGRMSALMGHILDLSRIGRIDKPTKPVSMDRVVANAVHTLQPRFDEAGVTLHVCEALPQVVGDEIRLQQLMQNLLENSMKYMGDQTRPKIEVGFDQTAEGGPALYVRDNGQGIKAESCEKVFSLFARLDTESEGSGVGLALVRKIARLHGGDAWIRSAGEKQGATVWVRLPFAEPGGA
jgi:signal transduction histidine kinase